MSEAQIEINPVMVEQTVLQATRDIAQGVKVVSTFHKRKLDADRAYDLALARAYMAHTGPAHEKKHAAEIATEQQRIEKDAAEVAYQHAQRQMKALEGKQSAFQTIAKSVVSMFGASGSGRGN